MYIYKLNYTITDNVKHSFSEYFTSLKKAKAHVIDKCKLYLNGDIFQSDNEFIKNTNMKFESIGTNTLIHNATYKSNTGTIKYLYIEKKKVK